jgi:aerobic C4-dicarboxylate transport protein
MQGSRCSKAFTFVKDEIMIVLGTAASNVVFPHIVQKLKHAGCDEVIVGFVLPAAYSFNLNGTAIYMALAVVFIAQATDTPFAAAQQLSMLNVLFLTSKGGTSIAGGAFVKLAATLESLHQLPLTGLTSLFGIDRLMSTAIALTNVIGNAVAVLAIAKSEKTFNRNAFDRALQYPATAVAVLPVS